MSNRGLVRSIYALVDPSSLCFVSCFCVLFCWRRGGLLFFGCCTRSVSAHMRLVTFESFISMISTCDDAVAAAVLCFILVVLLLLRCDVVRYTAAWL